VREELQENLERDGPFNLKTWTGDKPQIAQISQTTEAEENGRPKPPIL